MAIKILENPGKQLRPDGAIRADVAWKLFDPMNIGDVTRNSLNRMSKFTQWLWWELSYQAGFLNSRKRGILYIIAPEMTDAGRTFLERICSFWDTEINTYRNPQTVEDTEIPVKNAWIPPVYNVSRDAAKDPVQSALVEEDDAGICHFISPLTGLSHAFFRVYSINPGHTYSRYHSHTAREEHYLVLDGTGIARIAGRNQQVKPGDIVFKPTGPDLATQFIAGENGLRILDMEIWNDPARGDKDVVAYPDHGELCMFGPGWYNTVPLSAIHSAEDTMESYETGYYRNLDGSWSPREVPGFAVRKS